MKTVRHLAIALFAVALTGCLEVEQYPPWVNGEYDNKIDNLPAQANFHSDRLAWNAAITDRNHLQNEYNRTNHP